MSFSTNCQEVLIRSARIQGRHVLRDRFDLLLGHAEGDAGHHVAVVGALSGLEGQQLLLDIGGTLARELRKARRDPVPGRPVAAHAGRHAHLGVAAAVYLLAALPALRRYDRAWAALKAGEVRGEVLDIGVAQTRRHAAHDRVLAHAGFKILELLRQIVLILAGELGPEGIDGAVAVHAMTACTHTGLGLAGRDIAARAPGRRHRYAKQPDEAGETE